MKTLLSLLAVAWSGVAFGGKPSDPGGVPEGLAPADWSGIRAAHDAARHAPRVQESGNLVACNPGQQWRAEFDGRGFTVTPDHGAWTWGLELTGYGDRTLLSAASSSQLRHQDGRITCPRDENLTEWFINDSRGLEQGWDIRQRPERSDPAAPLRLHLASRGNVRPQIATGGASVSFEEDSAGSVLTYGGLKAWDADGKKLPVRFEQAGDKGIRIAVDDREARYPVTIDPIAQQAYLKASNAEASDWFGGAVAVSGDTVVIGAPGEDSAASGVNGDQTSNSALQSGAAYVFVRSGTAWALQAYLKASNPGGSDPANGSYGDLFGSAVAISGHTIVIGARDEDSAATGVNGDQVNNAAPRSGAAYVFTRSGTTWTQQSYLKASNAETADSFGSALAISGDTIVVGAVAEGSGSSGVNGDQTDNSQAYSGAAYIFTRSGTTWSQQAYLKGESPEYLDCFGRSVDISGDTVVVGSDRDHSETGAAYIFTRSGTTWTQQAFLTASNPSWDSYFGGSVAISGDTVVVGSLTEHSAATGVNGDQSGHYTFEAGAAYVFTRNGTIWSQQAYLKSSNTAHGDLFGSRVAISGDTVVVGAAGEDSSASGMNGDQTSNGTLQSGAAYLFKRSGSTWTQQAYLKSSNPGVEDYFGAVLAMSDDTVIFGTHYEDSSGSGPNGPQADNSAEDAGAAYITYLNYATLPPDISIRQVAGNEIGHGETHVCGDHPVDDAMEFSFTVSNPGQDPLELTGTPPVSITGSSDFTVSEQPNSPVAGGDSTTFKLRFAPTSNGPRTATVSIPTNDGDESPFLIHLTGRGLSYTTDTDGDGLSDAAESKLTAFNFDWQMKQTALVTAYMTSANRAGRYVPAQVHTLRAATPSIVRDPTNGRVKLTPRWEKSANLVDFFELPVPAGSSVSITPSGGIEFEFAPADNAAFFIIEQD